jgi:lipopolysaccharide export LptBFGC system permease protein LptF
MSHLKHNHPNCLNCHYPLAEFDKFCPNCGQKPMSPKSSMHDLLHEFFHTFWHLDGKFFMTLHHLLIPGKLTTEFFKGHLKRYAHPIQLFLVIGAFAFGILASKTHHAEEEAEKKVVKKRAEYQRKAFLKELDSVRQVLIPPQYADAQKQRLSDSLMFKMIYTDGKDNNQSDRDREKIEKEVNDALDKEFNKRYPNSLKEISTNLGTDSSRLTVKFGEEEDSIHEAREDFKDSIIDALVILSNESMDARILKKAQALKAKNPTERDFKEIVREAEAGNKLGLEEANNQQLIEKLRPKIDKIKQNRGIKEAIAMKEDTNNLSMMGQELRLPTREMYELTPEEIIEKYKIKGFWQRLGIKQGLKATQDSGSLIHFFMSKLFWATVVMIPALALFMSLYYRRRKRYYVEHIVFLLHFNTAAFLVLIPILWLSDYSDKVFPAYLLWFMVHFIASLKFYYHQNWAKTLLKVVVIGITYFFIASILSIVGGLLGLIFF